MATISQTLAIAGAAEGSYYSASGESKDYRYIPRFANSNSGMSFGIFQFDVSRNLMGQFCLKGILARAQGSKIIDGAAYSRIYDAAARPNAKFFFKEADLKTVGKLLAEPLSKMQIDNADSMRAKEFGGSIDEMISKAAKVWSLKNMTAEVLKSGTADNLHLFAYILASLNRREKNKPTFQKWLEGEQVNTVHGPKDGIRLKSPPSIEEMHLFFRSLTIWDGTQGKYQNLRHRLDPTLRRLLAVMV